MCGEVSLTESTVVHLYVDSKKQYKIEQLIPQRKILPEGKELGGGGGWNM